MEIIYRAIDGKEFDTKEKCLEYEEERSSYTMWGENGITKEINVAFVVYLPSEIAVKKFIKDSEENSCLVVGISKPGLYMWSSEDAYVRLEKCNIASIQKYIESQK